MAEYDHRPKGYLSIKEAAVRYEVSRAKMHRLIQGGQLQTQKDPRDRRVTLLLQEELDRLFDLPAGRADDGMNNEMEIAYTRVVAGRLTAELRGRVDALRLRVAARGNADAVDSTAIIREERERRSRELGGAATGA